MFFHKKAAKNIKIKKIEKNKKSAKNFSKTLDFIPT